jgi:hypothetical protein
MKVVIMKARIGIMSEEMIRRRLLAIAKGEYTPELHEPKIWCTSISVIPQVLGLPSSNKARPIKN